MVRKILCLLVVFCSVLGSIAYAADSPLPADFSVQVKTAESVQPNVVPASKQLAPLIQRFGSDVVGTTAYRINGGSAYVLGYKLADGGKAIIAMTDKGQVFLATVGHAVSASAGTMIDLLTGKTSPVAIHHHAGRSPAITPENNCVDCMALCLSICGMLTGGNPGCILGCYLGCPC